MSQMVFLAQIAWRRKSADPRHQNRRNPDVLYDSRPLKWDVLCTIPPRNVCNKLRDEIKTHTYLCELGEMIHTIPEI